MCVYTSSRVREDQGEIDEGFTKRFGVEVRRVEKEVLARESDVLIVLCSLNEDTKGMVNEEFLGLMKRDSVLINVARVSLFSNMCDVADVLGKGTHRRLGSPCSSASGKQDLCGRPGRNRRRAQHPGRSSLGTGT
jgi:lactate dehydrogenase-like 2-hydroxyacid dehydrogenase